MSKDIEYLSDGTIKFYQNRNINLIVVCSLILGLIVYAFIAFYLKAVPNKNVSYIVFSILVLAELPFIVFFFNRFLKPISLVNITSNEIEIHTGFKYEKLLWNQLDSVVLNRDDDFLKFKTKDNKNYRVAINFLTKESQDVLKDILSKHGLNY